jgi:hypothetical protein
MFSRIPPELHLEVLRRLDVPSILSMRAVDHRIHDLIDTNQDTIFRACLHNIECIGPHAILLTTCPPPNDTYSLAYAKVIHQEKQTMIQVAKICGITQNAKIDALYCIDQARLRAFDLWSESWSTMDDGEIAMKGDYKLREEILGQYTTSQLQHMVSTSIRVVFKISELMGCKFRGSALHYDDYSIFNGYLVANGLRMIVELEKRDSDGRTEYLAKAIWQTFHPNMHDELIRYLETRGTGLMTDPGIEIQQFFRDEDTLLDIGHSGAA